MTYFERLDLSRYISSVNKWAKLRFVIVKFPLYFIENESLKQLLKQGCFEKNEIANKHKTI